MKKINVIIPSYNYGQYLEICIMSVFLQRCSCKIEILISDDNSSDQSVGVIKRLKSLYETEEIKLTFESFDKRLGAMENICSLIEKCDGEYIAYLDSDDYWINPYKLQKQFEFMEANPDFSMCFTGYLGLTEAEGYIPVPEGDFWIGPPIGTNVDEIGDPDFIANVHNCIFSSSRFFRNYPDLCQRDFYSNFVAVDWAMNYELSLRGKIKLLNFPSFVYRIHPVSLTKTSKDADKSLTSPIFEQRKQEFLQQKFNNQ